MSSAMSSVVPERFVVKVDGCRLSGKSYLPKDAAAPGLGVVMVHGLLSASDVFDVRGREDMSLARFVGGLGYHVVTYDQRGTGESTAPDWKFGLEAHSLVDLPAVLAFCRERFGFTRVVFVSHSLGGTIWLRYMHGRPMAAGAPGPGGRDWTDQPEIVGGAVLASPPFFNHTDVPWRDIYDRGPSFIADIDHNRDGLVVREEFVRAQIALYQPRMAKLLLPRVLKGMLALGGRLTSVAGILRRLPTPAVIYHPDDFDDATFCRVLRSKMIDRGPLRLLEELYREIAEGPPSPLPPRLPFDGLAIGSCLDGFVPLAAVRRFGEQFRTARVIATEDEFGVTSGHVGYLFKKGVREPAFDAVAKYLQQVAART
jgi:pimeloyl-ACP methyl ester carboxylesterase